ncbi:MAG: hypothetical protein J4473_00630, partial [Candidatus Aenigmarchaeota archaeon]|nr:hypothetical protein [Candidatus Aenigmarchaeota archaeon]
MVKWTAEKIDEVFDKMNEELERVPTLRNFSKKYGRAIVAINQGRYDPQITTWNQYLEHRNCETHRQAWTPEKIDEVFDEMQEELRRNLICKEFEKKYGGALRAINQGRYDPQITTWNQYLKHRGYELNHQTWTPEKIDEVFDKMNEDLGRVPTRTEFEKEYGRAIVAINQGRYDPQITTWSQYLEHRGYATIPITTQQAFENLIKTGRGQEIVNWVREIGGDNGVLADI